MFKAMKKKKEKKIYSYRIEVTQQGIRIREMCYQSYHKLSVHEIVSM